MNVTSQWVMGSLDAYPITSILGMCRSPVTLRDFSIHPSLSDLERGDLSSMSLSDLYLALRTAARSDLKGEGTRTALQDLIWMSLDIVKASNSVPLISNVPEKHYAMREKNERYTRPFNEVLFNLTLLEETLFDVVFNMQAPFDRELDQYLYTAAMSYPIANDLTKDGDKKSPGTFFEILIGHIVASRYGINPQTSIEVPSLDREYTIPTDFIFRLGKDRRIHLPVKISTRERVVQVWAHQKLLDGIFGVDRFRGVLVCLTETNKRRNKSVVEVCLPNQWAAYQMYVAKLERVYYLDLPMKYAALRESYPFIEVWPFSRFYDEAENLFNP